ncbi:MAG: transposase [Planctomycetaceae bacterium]|nr:transposase [Planctomycetaceae bacterium]
MADIGVTPERFRERGERCNAMRYVEAYVAGSAIGDGRLVSAQGDTVKFRAFDYRTDQYIELEMTKVEFVEAYARHILPARLRRFRFAGLFRPKGQTARLSHCRKLLGSVEAEPAAPLMPPQDHAPVVHVIPTEAPEKAPDETTSELKHGLFCSKCAQRMTRVIEIDGSMSCWMLQVALLVVAYLNTQRFASFSLAVDRELIQAALQQVLALLQAEATITEAEESREWMRYAHVTLGDTFFHEAYYEVMLLFIAQQIAEQNASEERLAEAMLSPAHHAARGPPKHTDFKKKDGVHPR